MQNSSSCALVVLGIMYGGYRATAINTNENKIPVVDIDFSLLEDLANQAACASSDNNNQPPGPQSDGLLMYTSGTTGRPKGVLLSHANLLAGGRNTQIAHQLDADDRAMCILPLYHINGLIVTLMGPLVSRGSVVLPEKFSTSGFWPMINQYSCTWFSVVPTQISYLLHADVFVTRGATKF